MPPKQWMLKKPAGSAERRIASRTPRQRQSRRGGGNRTATASERAIGGISGPVPPRRGGSGPLGDRPQARRRFLAGVLAAFQPTPADDAAWQTEQAMLLGSMGPPAAGSDAAPRRCGRSDTASHDRPRRESARSASKVMQVCRMSTTKAARTRSAWRFSSTERGDDEPARELASKQLVCNRHSSIGNAVHWPHGVCGQ